MQTTTCTTVAGVFTNTSQADRAVDALFDAGFDASHIGVVTRETGTRAGKRTTTSEAQAEAEAENAGAGAATGAAAGAGIGALIGWGVLSGAIPVIGPALFAGTLGVLASNAGAGAAVAGVAGALTGWGVTDEHAKHYESEVAAGRVVVTVTAGDRCSLARSILRENGATSRDPEWDI